MPNIVLIFIDDLGYGDVGYTGATGYSTPNIDRLATNGLIFTNFYSAQAVCSASRAALLTGCYPNRIGITGALNHTAYHGLNSEETTIAEVLKTKGYRTAIVGKWHLGHHEKFLPLQHGFDEFLGLPYSNDMWPVDYDGKPHSGRKAMYPKLPLIEGNKTIQYIETLDDQNKLSAMYYERGIDFINKNAGNPFFLYLSHSMVHVPLGVSDQFRGMSQHGLFGDVMMELDWGIGNIVNVLRKNGILDNTLILFTSDNGPWLNYGNHAGSTGGLREGKGTTWEGGQRVPAFAYWKGQLRKGTSNHLLSTLDILPTLAKITGSQLPESPIDGVDFSPVLFTDSTESPRDHLYFYYNRNDLEAIRKDQWKLILPHSYRSYENVNPGNDGWPGPYARGSAPLSLYNLRRDPGERYDVKELYPDVLAEMQMLASKARDDLGDNLTGRKGKNQREPGWLIESALSRDLPSNLLAPNSKVNFSVEPASSYSRASLTDGESGSVFDHHRAWLGWQGSDLTITIDLEAEIEADSAMISFLSKPSSWIFPPSKVIWQVSTDGLSFSDIAEYNLILSQRDIPEIIDKKISLEDPVRFLRLEISAQGVCPDWHVASGEPAWLFLDELILW